MQKKQNQTSSHKHSHKKMGDKKNENRRNRRMQSEKRSMKYLLLSLTHRSSDWESKQKKVDYVTGRTY